MTPVVVQSEGDIRKVTVRLKSVAQRQFITESPKYSKTEEEALTRALPMAKEILATDCHAVLVFPMRFEHVAVSLSISVDAYNADKRWHISMARAGQGLFPTRVPDNLAVVIVKTFDLGLVEGPPEGASKFIRHFFAVYKPG
jgi:hypothetical protein